MIKFNSDHLIAGYIKQLLHDFNLPTYKVYTAEFAEYYQKHAPEEDPRIIESIPKDAFGINYTSYTYYIKDNKIQKYMLKKDGSKEWVNSNNKHYHYNKKEINQTKNLYINNNYYDNYTHEYLGDFLRFQRDYNNINLMPLYNCFGGKICSNLNLKINIDNTNVSQNNSIIETSFDSSRADYKIYVLPVKLFQNYTIAIDCEGKIEICCGFYDKYLDSSKDIKNMTATTYRQYVDLSFNKPILYDALDVKNWTSNNTNPARADVIQHEKNLKMFIKVPVQNKSSITVLEGNYLNYNDAIFNKIEYKNTSDNNYWELEHNKVVTNYFEGNILGENNLKTTIPNLNDRVFKPISQLQLLSLNTGISYPFADRLIEYLLKNTICPLDSISDNIKRVQKVMSNNGYSFSYNGLWEQKMQIIAYDFMNSTHPIIGKPASIINHDIFGYIDKDVEKFYVDWIHSQSKPDKIMPKDSISSINIYKGDD